MAAKHVFYKTPYDFLSVNFLCVDIKAYLETKCSLTPEFMLTFSFFMNKHAFEKANYTKSKR